MSYLFFIVTTVICHRHCFYFFRHPLLYEAIESFLEFEADADRVAGDGEAVMEIGFHVGVGIASLISFFHCVLSFAREESEGWPPFSRETSSAFVFLVFKPTM